MIKTKTSRHKPSNGMIKLNKRRNKLLRKLKSKDLKNKSSIKRNKRAKRQTKLMRKRRKPGYREGLML
jgi:hypothetical protein